MQKKSKLIANAVIYLSSLVLFEVNSQAADCPQVRKTRIAPEEFLSLKNPFPPTPENMEEGKKLYLQDAKPAPCVRCHGEKGDGDSKMGKYLKPSPRNFTCKQTMADISEGQMFWVIRNGSFGSGMAPSPEKLLPDDSVWKIILFERSFQK